jgi:lipopolysaccharide export system permease protein
MPTSFRAMRDLLNQVQSDFLTRIVRPGAFNTLEPGLVFHYRERGPGGALRGIFMYDSREKNQKSVYLAENGVTAKIGDENFLVLQTGTIQRQDKGARAPAMITFDSYALDLSHFGAGHGGAPLWPRERSTEAMLHYNLSDPYVRANEGQFRSDLNDRFIGPLYALAMGMIAFAALGAPQTTRQNRGFAIAGAVVCAVILRLGGFGATAMMGHDAAAVPFAYALPLIGFLLATLYAFRSAFERRFGRGRPELAAA